MLEERTILLPSERGASRSFVFGFTYNGDLRLSFGDSGAETTKQYGLAHGNEVMLFASLIGYYTRLGKSEDEIRDIFMNAGESALKNRYKPAYTMGSRALYLAQGEYASRFDKNNGEWRALMTPTPPQPSNRVIGGTALYTCRENIGNMKLIIAKNIVEDFSTEILEEERESATYLNPDDIPPIASTIAESAMGEYRQDIAELIEDRFQE